MVKYCCAYGCKNEWQPNGNIRFHRFPLKQPEILKLWLQAIRRENFTPTSSTVICSVHFTEDDYLESSLDKKLLKKDAIPSVFTFNNNIKKYVPGRQLIKRRYEESTSQEVMSAVQYFASKIKNLFQPLHPIIENEELHELQIIKYISDTYAKLRIQTHAKKKNLQSLGHKATIRQKLTKTILFYHV